MKKRLPLNLKFHDRLMALRKDRDLTQQAFLLSREEWPLTRSSPAILELPHMTIETRELAHQLIDRLPETQLSGLVQFLETIIDPVATALRNAPLDDEPESEGEKSAVTEARTWLQNNGGKGIPHAEAMHRLGLE